MSEHNKHRKSHLLYLGLIVFVYLDIKSLLLSRWLEPGDERMTLYRVLLLGVFSVVINVVVFRIFEGRKINHWWSVMKKNLVAWIIVLLYAVAFVVLMVEAYKYMHNERDAILLIVASSVIFLPNLWALTDYLGSKMMKKPESDSPKTE